MALIIATTAETITALLGVIWFALWWFILPIYSYRLAKEKGYPLPIGWALVTYLLPVLIPLYLIFRTPYSMRYHLESTKIKEKDVQR